ncbi:hypothetical protein LARV_03649 [Longilinea arvoryzae]|uniref:Uncharacterized protein n=1 Tax=Longilinea arvoryzae TaxID=360412 RepID=A0A0S7BL85_9CHLR|nr:hypothetical protein [Longilinea arvoryzae]GAP15856.1 hypothetical protein LARV_03649 [Longilinea arvoryzae]
MLKILGRVLLILLATGLVIGATYAVSLNSQLSTADGPGMGGFGERAGLSDGSSAPQAGPERSPDSQGLLPGGGEFRGGREGGSAFGWMEVLKSLGVIIVVTGGVILIQKAHELVRRSRKLRAEAPPAE